MDQLLNTLGEVNRMAARTTHTARRLQTAANAQDEAHRAEGEQLAAHIQTVGVGADPEAELAYCRGLMDRHRLNQAHTLAGADAACFPDVGAHQRRLEKGLAGEYVPPDVPHWRRKPAGSEPRYLPLNGVEDRPKFHEMQAAMRAGEWQWSAPLVRCGDQLLTGSHRYAAAKETGIRIPTVTIDQVFRDSGLDFESLYGQIAAPWSGWLNNMAHVLEFLPADVRERYGLDLG